MEHKKTRNDKIFIQTLSNPYYGSLGMLAKEDCVALAGNVMAENGYESIVAALDAIGLKTFKWPKVKNTIDEVNIINFKSMFELIRFLRQKRFRCATVFGNARTPVGFMACYFGEYRIFMNHTATLPLKWWQRKVFKFFLSRFDAVKVESETEKRIYTEFGIEPHRIFVIPIPIDRHFLQVRANAEEYRNIRERFGIKDDEKIIIYLASLREQKGADTVIKALKVLKKRGVKVKLLQVGQDLLKERLGQSFGEMASSFGVSNLVVQTGRVENEELRTIIQMSDIGIQSTEIEGQCIVAFEYAACGIPECLTTIPSFEVFGDNILRHHPKDHNKLADNIQFYFNNPDVAKRHVEANQKLVETKYDYDMIYEKMRELLIDQKENLTGKRKWFKRFRR